MDRFLAFTGAKVWGCKEPRRCFLAAVVVFARQRWERWEHFKQLRFQWSLQGGAPQVISWFIIPLTIDVSTISPSEIRVINQLSYLGGTTLYRHFMTFPNPPREQNQRLPWIFGMAPGQTLSIHTLFSSWAIRVYHLVMTNIAMENPL